MKSFFIGTILTCTAVGLFARANGANVLSLNFVAPYVTSTIDVVQPRPGEIVFQDSDKSFQGYTGNSTTPWEPLSGAGGGGLPAGAVIPYAGSSAPSGYLLADGSAVSRTTFAALFAAIGISYGSGDGSTTFNLPDLRGIFIRGAGTQTISSVTYSGTLAAKQTDQFQGHRHSEMLDVGSGTGGAILSVNHASVADGSFIGLPISDGTNGTPRTGDQTRPANISLTYIIKI